jgi:hypothetical protein
VLDAVSDASLLATLPLVDVSTLVVVMARRITHLSKRNGCKSAQKDECRKN